MALALFITVILLLRCLRCEIAPQFGLFCSQQPSSPGHTIGNGKLRHVNAATLSSLGTASQVAWM